MHKHTQCESWMYENNWLVKGSERPRLPCSLMFHGVHVVSLAANPKKITTSFQRLVCISLVGVSVSDVIFLGYVRENHKKARPVKGIYVGLTGVYMSGFNVFCLDGLLTCSIHSKCCVFGRLNLDRHKNIPPITVLVRIRFGPPIGLYKDSKVCSLTSIFYISK
jgi:hypothetical protein